MSAERDRIRRAADVLAERSDALQNTVYRDTTGVEASSVSFLLRLVATSRPERCYCFGDEDPLYGAALSVADAVLGTPPSSPDLSRLDRMDGLT